MIQYEYLQDIDKLSEPDINRFYNILSILDSEYDNSVYVYNMTDVLKKVLNKNGFEVCFDKNIGYRIKYINNFC